MSPKPRPITELGKTHLAVETYAIHQGKVLMHRRSEQKKRFPGYMLGPGGRIDEGEDAAVAAAREIKEETGIDVPVEALQLKVVCIHHHIDREEVWVSLVFRAVLEEVSGSLIATEDGSSEWVALPDVFREPKLFPPTLEGLDHVLDDKPGILYTNSEWRDSQLVRLLSQTIV